MTDKTGWQPEENLAEGNLAEKTLADQNSEMVSDSEKDAGETLSTVEVVGLLISEGRDYAANEVERQKLRAAILGSAARDTAIMGVVALFLLMGTLIAGLIGLILGLTPLVGGALAATGIVMAASLLLILLLLLIARARVKKAVRLSFGRKTADKRTGDWETGE